MPDLHFAIESAQPQLYAASPLLDFKLRVEDKDQPAAEVQSVLLRVQLRIEPTRRRYAPDEQERLFDLFGEPERWGQTLRSMLWTHTQVVIPAFSGSTVVDMPVPCTFDFNVAATKYFHALEGGEVPMCALFSGTVFSAAGDGSLRASQISWEREATFRLPVETWQKMMDHYYPNSVWLRVPRDFFERLRQYKTQHAIASWDEALERLLPAADEEPIES